MYLMLDLVIVSNSAEAEAIHDDKENEYVLSTTPNNSS